MRPLLIATNTLVILALSGCPNRADVQCETDPNCNLTTGGLCASAVTGNHWCAYPDPSCEGGYRYDDRDVGDGVAGQCVAPMMPDAAVDAAPITPLASCVGLARSCGATGDDDCCNSPMIPAGTYYRSYDAANDAQSGDMHSPATLSTFRLDKYEVTVGRFRQFVVNGQGTQRRPPAATAGAHPKIAGSGWDSSWNTNLAADTPSLIQAIKCKPGTLFATWTDDPGSNEERPINCVTWYEAVAFCAWDGGYLPTEAEWNYAAAGGEQQRVYPWSSPPSSQVLDGSHASYFDGTSCVGDGASGCTRADLVKVGTKPDGNGRWGQSEMTGNVQEWTVDYYGDYTSTCVDCANLDLSRNRSVRGGSFNAGGTILRSSGRLLSEPALRDYYIGIRCARAM